MISRLFVKQLPVSVGVAAPIKKDGQAFASLHLDLFLNYKDIYLYGYRKGRILKWQFWFVAVQDISVPISISN